MVPISSTVLCWAQPDRDSSDEARSHHGRLPGLSTIYLLDARRKLRFVSSQKFPMD